MQIKLTFSWQTVVYLETYHFLGKHKSLLIPFPLKNMRKKERSLEGRIKHCLGSHAASTLHTSDIH